MLCAYQVATLDKLDRHLLVLIGLVQSEHHKTIRPSIDVFHLYCLCARCVGVVYVGVENPYLFIARVVFQWISMCTRRVRHGCADVLGGVGCLRVFGGGIGVDYVCANVQ